MSARLDRRTLLVIGGVVLSGCAAEEPGRATITTPEPSTSTPTDAPTSAVTSPPEAQLPAPVAWSPSPNDVDPGAKVAATRVVEALGTVAAGARAAGGAPAQRLAGIGADPRLAAQAGPLVPPASPAVTAVVYPQYGGLTADAASVMVVAEQTWQPGAGAAPARRTVTADVRLSRTNAGWAVTQLRPVAAGRPAADTLTGRVAALVASPQMVLPDAAVADLGSGRVDDSVVETMLGLTRDFSMSVSVFSAGHPENVFGTTSPSNHLRGRAVDVWALDGTRVADLALDDPLLLRFLRAAAANGSDEIGGPVVPPGAGAGYFANDLHRDHVHIGFDA